MSEKTRHGIFEGATVEEFDETKRRIITMAVAISQNGPILFGLSNSGEVYLYNFPEAKWEHSKIATTRRIFA